MADELVGEAQAFRIQHAIFVEHHRVVQAAAEREAAVAQIFHLVHETKCAGTGDFLQVRRLGEIDFDRLRGALDHRVAEIDGEGKLVALVGLEARPFVAVAHFHAPRHAQEALGRRLLEHARLLDEEDVGRGAAIHDWQLGGIEIDIRVVDAEPAERGHQVLHGVDLHAVAHEAGRKARLANELGARGNVDRRGEVGAPEHDAAIGRRGPQR